MRVEFRQSLKRKRLGPTCNNRSIWFQNLARTVVLYRTVQVRTFPPFWYYLSSPAFHPRIPTHSTSPHPQRQGERVTRIYTGQLYVYIFLLIKIGLIFRKCWVHQSCRFRTLGGTGIAVAAEVALFVLIAGWVSGYLLTVDSLLWFCNQTIMWMPQLSHRFPPTSPPPLDPLPPLHWTSHSGLSLNATFTFSIW